MEASQKQRWWGMRSSHMWNGARWWKAVETVTQESRPQLAGVTDYGTLEILSQGTMRASTSRS